MEFSLYRYILQHSRRQQILLTFLTFCTFPVVYITLELPKIIVNDAIEGGAVPEQVWGFSVDQVSYLFILCGAFLLAVIANGAIKYVINVYRGALGERLLQQLRYELYQRLLRFPLPHFKRVSQGELIPLITAETEPLGEFIGESYSLPIFQGGLLLTYLIFIFNQNWLLGMAAVALYPFQLWLIPRLQKRVNRLSKQRVKATRKFSGWVGESVSGIEEVHGNDAGHWFKAHAGRYLNDIFTIRLSIYKRKFFIKFLNNFIAQITPFFFYAVGGYFVIMGEMSIGALIAVLAAYKDLAGPWKELLRYYQRREDMQVKYQQVVEQFNPQQMLEAELLELDREEEKTLDGAVTAQRVGYSAVSGERLIHSATFDFSLHQHVALLGSGSSGKDVLAKLIARLYQPDEGQLLVGEHPFRDFPLAVTGRRISYVGATAYIFSGSVRENLLYGIRHDPPNRGLIAPQHDAQTHSLGNLSDTLVGDWVDYRRLGVDSHEALNEWLLDCIAATGMGEDIFRFGMQASISQQDSAMLVSDIMRARRHLQHRPSRQFAQLVEPFHPDKYNSYMSVGENIMFGSHSLGKDIDSLVQTPLMKQVLDEAGLSERFIQIGHELAGIMIEIFADVAPDSNLFERFSFINHEDLPQFKKLLAQVDGKGLSALKADDQLRLMRLPFKLVLARHRLGLIDETLQQDIVNARHIFARCADAWGEVFDFYHQDQYNPALTVQENILFGKVAHHRANAQQKVDEMVSDYVLELGLQHDIMLAGLDYDVGIGGAYLSLVQKQALALARGLVKSPDLLIIDGALDLFDQQLRERLLRELRRRQKGRGLVWSTESQTVADTFDKVLLIEKGEVTSTN